MVDSKDWETPIQFKENEILGRLQNKYKTRSKMCQILNYETYNQFSVVQDLIIDVSIEFI